MLQRSIHLNYVCRTETQTVFQTVAYLCLSLASIFNIVCMTICLDRFTILSLPCIFNIGSGQMPQECERHQQVDQEGAAGDGGGEGQGGGQAASTGALVQYERTAMSPFCVQIHNSYFILARHVLIQELSHQIREKDFLSFHYSPEFWQVVNKFNFSLWVWRGKYIEYWVLSIIGDEKVNI